jgi:hypothetical protein
MDKKLAVLFFLLLFYSLIPLVSATVVVKTDMVVRTRSNNAKFKMGKDYTFDKVRVNSTHAGFDRQYSTEEFANFTIWIDSPNDVQFTLEEWFPTTGDTYANITITSPASTDITFHVYSPQFGADIVVTGAKSYGYGDGKIDIVGNTDVSSTIVIYTYITPVEEPPQPPSTGDVVITDMDAGDWLFAEERYYHFKAEWFWVNDTVKIKFSDATDQVIEVYYDLVGDSFGIVSGSDYIDLGHDVSETTVNHQTIVIFPIRLKFRIVDTLDVDIYSYGNNTIGQEAGWDLKAIDYFNIYARGGTTETGLETYGDAGRLTGGDVFNLWANESSWARDYVILKDLQAVKMLAALYIDYTAGQAQPNFYFGIDYKVSGSWVSGWYLRLQFLDFPASLDNDRWIHWRAYLYNRGVEVDNQDMYGWYEINKDGTGKQHCRVWIDLWFNRINASSTIGAAVTSYGYGMVQNTPDNFWQALMGYGAAWTPVGANMSRFLRFDTLKDASNNVLYAKEIELVRVWVRVQKGGSATVRTTSIAEMPRFDKTISGKGMEGIATPVFEDTITPNLPTAGPFGWIGAALINIFTALWDAISPALFAIGSFILSGLDAALSFTGNPTLATDMWNTLTTFGGQIGSIVTVLAAQIGNLVTFLVEGSAFVITYIWGGFWYIISTVLSPAFGLGTFVVSMFQIAGAWLSGSSVTVLGNTYDFTALANMKLAGFQGGMVIFVLMGMMYMFMIPVFCVTRMSLEPLLAPFRLAWGMLEFLMKVTSFTIRVLQIVWNAIHTILSALKFW